MWLQAATTTTSAGLSFGGFVSVIGGVLGLLGLVAGAAAVLRANYMRATVEALKESNSALTERKMQLEEAEREKDKDLARLANENSALQTYVSGTEAVKQLSELLRKQHTEQMDMQRSMHIDEMSRWAELSEAFSAHLMNEHPRAKRTTKKAAVKASSTRRRV